MANIGDEKSKFCAAIAAALVPVEARCTYLDTVQVLLRRPLRKAVIRDLQQLNKGYVKWGRSQSPSHRWRVRIQTPSHESLAFLAQAAPEHVVNRFDLALDLLTQTSEQAGQLQTFLARHLTQPWRRNRCLKRVETTDYFAGAWKRRNIVLYSDRLSKATGKPACHIEFRYYGADVCRTFGISQVKDLDRLDPAAAVGRSARLSLVVPARLDKVIREIARNTLARHRRTNTRTIKYAYIEGRVRGIMARLIPNNERQMEPYELHLAPAQWLLDQFPHHVSRAVIHVPPHTLLDGLVLAHRRDVGFGGFLLGERRKPCGSATSSI